MTTTSLLDPISFLHISKTPIPLKWNPLFQTTYPIRHTLNLRTRPPTNLSINCVSKTTGADLIIQKQNAVVVKKSKNVILLNKFVKALKILIHKPVMVAVVLGLAFMLSCDPHSAFAAGGGGRMGGRSFQSSSRNGGGGGGGGGREYTTIRGGRGISPGFGYSVPYYAPSPFGFAGPAIGFGAGSGIVLLMTGFAGFVLVSGFLTDRSEGGSLLTATQKTTVIKLQVGLLGMARSFQKDLDKIAETADTSSCEGLSYVLTETTLALLRHPDCCISCYSSVDVKRSIEDGEKRFNKLSIEERGKFNEETLVNVNNIKRQSTRNRRSAGFSNEYIVITILVAAEGEYRLPAINSSRDLKEALQVLGSIPSKKTMAVEVLWTPQNENDTLSERELLEDYPLLRPL